MLLRGAGWFPRGGSGQGSGLSLVADRMALPLHRASGLNLVVAAITLWNTVYLERAASLLGRTQKIDLTLLQHVSPLGWEQVGLTGDYLWRTDKRLAKGGYRTLRPPAARLSGP